MRPSPDVLFRRMTARFAICLLIACSAGAQRPAVADEPGGEQVYRQKCASCHGPQGEGTEDNYPEPLVGDRSVGELARYITENMPDESPEECVGEEAARVAAWMHDAFYSPTAQARLKPPRIELSRLTVPQYRNTVADLLGSFSRSARWGDERGLHGEYYESRRQRGKDRAIDRRDAVVQFDFGDSSPDPEKIKPEEFTISWEGSVLAEDTGDYEFIVQTENGARLWVNDDQNPLIDARVRSGDQTAYRKSILLLGGRAYPLKLEFLKSKSESTASIRLGWKRPHQADELIPERNLSPERFPETFIVQTPFPPDDRSTGYERGTSISKAWDDATTSAAIDVAGYVVAHLRDLADLRGDPADRDERLRRFCRRFAEAAFRRPLSDEQQTFFIDRQFEQAPDAEAGLKRSVLLVLKSPRFLYRNVGDATFDDYDVAAWLSYGLWDSLPDRRLLEAAAAGELNTREQIVAQAERMVDDERTRAKLRAFFHQWLKIDDERDLAKDAEVYPGFDEFVASDLRTSLDLFLDDVVWSETSDFRRLLLAESVFLNGRLAKFYGVDLPEDAPFQKTGWQPEYRAGVLSHPYLLAKFAYHSTSSPIHRGVFLARSVLGRTLKPPPQAVTPAPPELHAGLTTRERVDLQTQPENCRRCHGMINPLGFSLEHFDAVGRYRTEEKGKAIDALGHYVTRGGEEVRFDGTRELAKFLADSPETHEAFIEQLFHYLIKQPLPAFGPETLPTLRNSFAEHEYNVRRLLVETATTSALAARDLQK